MNNQVLRGIYLRLAGAVTLVVMLALGVNAFLSQQSFERALAPQMAAKVASVGVSIRALVQRAMDSGIGFQELYGVTERFQEIKEEAPEIAYFALTDTEGVVRHEKGQGSAEATAYFRSAEVLALLNTPEVSAPIKRLGDVYIVSLPVHGGQGALGVLHLGLSVSVFDALVKDMLFDVLVVLVVSLFFTLELLHFMAGAKLESSLRELSATFDRAAAGDFSVQLRSRSQRTQAAFSGLLEQLDANLLRVNRAYEALVQDVEKNRRGPAHERSPALAQAQQVLREYAGKFKFGSASRAQRDPETQLAKVRAPLFMFILAEELTRSFLPAYVNDLLIPIPGISTPIVVGLPIALFMLIVAVGQPFLGVYTERVGQRKAMLTGAAIAAAGFFATALAYNVLDLLLWRSLCALGYAMVFVAAQAYVLDNAPAGNRAKSFALFVGAIMAATVCGPSIGGILADNIGERPTFVIAALLALSSMAVIRFLPASSNADDAKRSATRLPKWSEIGSLVTNPRFMAVTGLAAMPAKMLLTGVCFYLLPLYVLAQGSTQAMAGRILMTYAVVMVVMAPLTAGLAHSRERMHWLVGGGLIVSGLGGMLMLAGSHVGWLFLAVALVGVGQAMSISAQSALVAEHCAPEIARLGEGVVYGVYRLLERLGNTAGPLVAAALAMYFDQRTGFVALGAAVCLSGALFMLATRQKASAPSPADKCAESGRTSPSALGATATQDTP
jgi:MFS family permease